VIGGIEEGETAQDAAIREIKEETGYTDVIFKRELGNPVQAAYFAKHKDENRISISSGVYFELGSDARVPLVEDEGNEILWISKNDFVPGKMINAELPQWLIRLNQKEDTAYTGSVILVNSGKFSDAPSEEAKKKITEAVGGKLVTRYKIRDAIFARQRYWGEPIPLVHTKDGVISGLKENKLPLKLPNVKSYEPQGTGESPLASVKAWVKAGYESNTMPGWAGSSWYFLRYMDPKNKKAFVSPSELEYWDSVDMYVGGQEHATGHLLYSRFWHKCLKDLGFVHTEEPFKALRNQGMILAVDGRKMSKRWGNVINPDEVVANYGADTMRVYEMFMGPFDQSLPWSTESIIGSRRFIERVWKLQERVAADAQNTEKLDFTIHQTIKKVTDDIADMHYNTAISSLMILLNEFEKQEKITRIDYQVFLQLIAPFAPHITEEIWNILGNKKSIHVSGWPVADAKKLVAQKVIIVVQVNGKVRGQLEIEPNKDQSAVEKIARTDSNVERALEGKDIRKVIFVPNKIINFVV
jgi:leucyl-tRNA synthetase